MKSKPRLFLSILFCAMIAIWWTVLPSAADPPSCAPFNDPGCFFGENWENGTMTSWSANDPSNFSNVSPGLNGTARAAQLNYVSVDQGIWADTGMSRGIAEGNVVWIEFWIKYSSTFQWAAGPSGVPGAKTFEFHTGDRFLLVFHNYNGDVTKGWPQWSVYANSAVGGLELPGQDPINPFPINIVAGGTYHVITEVKFSRTNGYMKTWINGTLVINTGPCVTINVGNAFQYVRIGGQYGNDGNSMAWYDQIRFTTTNIAPSTTPAIPTFLLVR